MMTFLFLIIFILIVLALAHMPIFETFQMIEQYEDRYHGYENIYKKKRDKKVQDSISSGQKSIFKKHFAQHDNE